MIILALLLVVVTSIPAWIGIIAKHDIQNTIKTIDSSFPQLAVDWKSYRHGWLRSRAVVDVTLPPVDIGLRQQVRARHELVMDIRHGYSIWPLRPARISIEFDPQFDSATQKTISRVFRQDNPEAIHYRKTMSGLHVLDVDITPGHSSESHENRVHFAGATLHVEWDSDQIRLLTSIPRLFVRRPRYVLRAKHAHLTLSADRVSDVTWDAVSTGGTERLYMKNIGSSEIDVSGMRFIYNVDAQPSNRIMHVHGGHGISRIHLEGQTYHNTTFDLDAYQVPGVLILAYIEALATNSPGTRGEAVTNYLSGRATLNDLIERNPVLRINDFRTHGPHGQVDGTIAMQWVRKRQPLEWSHWRDPLNISAHLKATSELYETLLPQWLAGCLPNRGQGEESDKMPANSVKALARKGWLTKRGDRLFGQASYRDGRLSVQYTEWPVHTVEPFRECVGRYLPVSISTITR